MVKGLTMDETLTAQEAADILGYHPTYFRELLRKGTVKGRQFNRVWMVDPAEVERIKTLQGPGGRLPKVPKQ